MTTKFEIQKDEVDANWHRSSGDEMGKLQLSEPFLVLVLDLTQELGLQTITQNFQSQWPPEFLSHEFKE